MEEHMYTFLNQKYGLRSLTMTQANSLMQAVKKYQREDFETLMFSRILRAQLPESYRSLSLTLKSFIQSQINELEKKDRILAGDEDVAKELLDKVLTAVDEYEVIDDKRMAKK